MKLVTIGVLFALGTACSTGALAGDPQFILNCQNDGVCDYQSINPEGVGVSHPEILVIGSVTFSGSNGKVCWTFSEKQWTSSTCPGAGPNAPAPSSGM